MFAPWRGESRREELDTMPFQHKQHEAVALRGANTGRRYCLWREGAQRASRSGKRYAMPASDEGLIGCIARGDASAMHVLYARHHVGIFRFVLHLLRDRAMAEDVISDVFLGKAFGQAPRGHRSGLLP